MQSLTDMVGYLLLMFTPQPACMCEGVGVCVGVCVCGVCVSGCECSVYVHHVLVHMCVCVWSVCVRVEGESACVHRCYVRMWCMCVV